MSENKGNMVPVDPDMIEETAIETVAKVQESAIVEEQPAPAPAPAPAKASKKKKGKKSCPVPVKKTTIGGQALIEGVMMVGPSRTAMAVRKGDGTIYVEEIKQSEKTSYFDKVPFIRGCIRFYKMLVTGTGALMKAADISEEGKPEDKKEGEKKTSGLDDFLNKHKFFLACFGVYPKLFNPLGIGISHSSFKQRVFNFKVNNFFPFF